MIGKRNMHVQDEKYLKNETCSLLGFYVEKNDSLIPATILHCARSQNSADLIYTAAKA